MYLDEMLELLLKGKKRGAWHKKFLKNDVLCYFTYAQRFYVCQNYKRYPTAHSVTTLEMTQWPKEGWE